MGKRKTITDVFPNAKITFTPDEPVQHRCDVCRKGWVDDGRNVLSVEDLKKAGVVRPDRIPLAVRYAHVDCVKNPHEPSDEVRKNNLWIARTLAEVAHVWQGSGVQLITSSDGRTPVLDLVWVVRVRCVSTGWPLAHWQVGNWEEVGRGPTYNDALLTAIRAGRGLAADRPDWAARLSEKSR